MIFSNFCCRNPTFKWMTMRCVIRILVNFGFTETHTVATYNSISSSQDIIWYWQSEILVWIQRIVQPIYPSYMSGNKHCSKVLRCHICLLESKWGRSGLKQHSCEFKLCLALKIICKIRMGSNKTHMQIHKCNIFLNCKHNWWATGYVTSWPHTSIIAL